VLPESEPPVASARPGRRRGGSGQLRACLGLLRAASGHTGGAGANLCPGRRRDVSVGRRPGLSVYKHMIWRELLENKTDVPYQKIKSMMAVSLYLASCFNSIQLDITSS
jgi:hypothetical protein